MPDVTSLRASLTLDDRQYQQALAQAKAATLNFAQASQAAAVTQKELDRALNSNATFGKRLTETQKQQIAFTKELTAERIKHAQQLSGEGRLAQELGAKYSLLSNEQRAILQATKEATAAWIADQKAQAAAEAATLRQAQAEEKLLAAQVRRQALAAERQLASEAAAFEKAADTTKLQTRALADQERQAVRSAESLKTMQAVLLGLGAAAVAAGFKFVLDAALQDTDALNKLKVQTGATGAEFESLRASMERVHKQVPNNIGDVADAIAQLHARTGESGPALEGLARRILTLQRLFGGDLKGLVEDSAKLFGQWGISIKSQGPALDLLTKAFQKTGIPVNRLEEDLIKYGPLLRNMGLSFAGAAAQVAILEKSHVDLGRAIMPLRQAMQRFAKEGVTDPAQAMLDLEQRIKDAKTQTEAFTLAAHYFGARGGTDFAREIREGHLEVGKLKDALLDSKGAIEQAGGAVDTLSTRFATLRNDLQEAFKPIGHQFEDSIKEMIAHVDTVIVPKLADWSKRFGAFLKSDAGPGVMSMAPPRLGGSSGLPANVQPLPPGYLNQLNRVANRVVGGPPALPGLGIYGGGNFAQINKSAGQLLGAPGSSFGSIPGANELDIAKTPPSGQHQAIIPEDTKKAIEAVKGEIADYTFKLGQMNVPLTTARDNVKKLTTAQVDFLAENRAAPQALRLTALALKEQFDALAANEKQIKKTDNAQEQANRRAREEVARLQAQIADLSGGNKLQSVLTRLAGASPQDIAAVTTWYNRLQIATERTKAQKDAADLLASRLGKLDSSYQSNHLQLLRMNAATDEERYALDTLGITLDKVPASLKASFDASFKMEQQTRAAAAAFALAKEQADRYFSLFRSGAEAIDQATLELAKANATLTLSGSQLAVENIALDQFKKHFMELPGPLQVITLALAAMKKEAAEATANLEKTGDTKLASKILEGKSSFGGAVAQATIDVDAAAAAKRFEEYYNRVIIPMNEAAERAARQATDFMARLADGTESVFQQVFQDIGQHGFGSLFKNIYQGFSQMLVQMASAYLASTVRRAIFGDAEKAASGGGFGGLLGGLLGGLFGAGGGAGSDITDASQVVGDISGFASGGSIRAGQLVMVGERGPELFRPRQSGTIVPNHQLAGAGGVHINMTVVTQDAGSFRRNQDQIHGDLFRAAQRIQRRNGG